MLFEKESHHSSTDSGFVEYIDRYGQIHALHGRGFRGSAIWEQVNSATVTKTWLELPDGTVVWEMSPRRPQPLEALLRLRDWSYPDCTLVQWVGNDDDGQFTYVNRPPSQKSATVTDSIARPCRISKGKARKIRHRNR